MREEIIAFYSKSKENHSTVSRIFPFIYFVLYAFCVLYNRTEPHSRAFFIYLIHTQKNYRLRESSEGYEWA